MGVQQHHLDPIINIILSYYHIIILSYYHIIILSYYRIIILSYYHIIILSYYHIIILSYYHIIILSSTEIQKIQKEGPKKLLARVQPRSIPTTHGHPLGWLYNTGHSKDDYFQTSSKKNRDKGMIIFWIKTKIWCTQHQFICFLFILLKLILLHDTQTVLSQFLFNNWCVFVFFSLNVTCKWRNK